MAIDNILAQISNLSQGIAGGREARKNRKQKWWEMIGDTAKTGAQSFMGLQEAEKERGLRRSLAELSEEGAMDRLEREQELVGERESAGRAGRLEEISLTYELQAKQIQDQYDLDSLARDEEQQDLLEQEATRFQNDMALLVERGAQESELAAKRQEFEERMQILAQEWGTSERLGAEAHDIELLLQQADIDKEARGEEYKNAIGLLETEYDRRLREISKQQAGDEALLDLKNEYDQILLEMEQGWQSAENAADRAAALKRAHVAASVGGGDYESRVATLFRDLSAQFFNNSPQREVLYNRLLAGNELTEEEYKELRDGWATFVRPLAGEHASALIESFDGFLSAPSQEDEDDPARVRRGLYGGKLAGGGDPSAVLGAYKYEPPKKEEVGFSEEIPPWADTGDEKKLYQLLIDLSPSAVVDEDPTLGIQYGPVEMLDRLAQGVVPVEAIQRLIRELGGE